MTRLHYLALLGQDLQARKRIAARARDSAWRTLIDEKGLLLCAAGGPVLVLPDGLGAMLGPLYDRWQSLAVTDAEALAGMVRAGGPQRLTERCWGPYVAFLRTGEGGSCALRAPFGELPCWWVRSGDAALVASDLALLGDAGASLSVDWEALGRQLLFDGLRWPATCISSVQELPGGDCLALRQGVPALSPVWSPWTIVTRTAPLDDAPEAAHRLRDVVCQCVRARAGEASQVLLRLSGGLDSSIVAVALAHAGTSFTCLNLISRDRSGDEWEYAEDVANALGSPLDLAVRQVSEIDLCRSPSAHLPRPSAHGFFAESDRLASQIAAGRGADAIFDGAGGDNVFCSLQSVAPVLDALRTFGFGPEARGAARELCVLAQSSLATVWRRTLARSLRRTAERRWPADTSLLAPDFAASQPARAEHPWLRPPRGVLPGQAAHAALLLAATEAVGDRDSALPKRCSPLLSQPVVETCMRVPSWMWMGEGHNRLIARRAFAPMLPPQIAFRRGKGSPDSFLAELFEANAPLVRELLADGLLARHGLIDRRAVASLLSMPPALIGGALPRLMRFVDAEVWARSRTQRGE